MTQYLKGNYKLDVKIDDAPEAANTTDAFERVALARLGGSICFVSKKAFLWTGPDSGKAPDTAKRSTNGPDTGKSPTKAEH